LFFTSDRPGGFGGRDIYMVKKNEKDKWSDPVNLGSAINTAFDEDAPYFHPDGKSLYYSSNGPGSMGGFDIFVTELEPGSKNSWLPPLNMGPPVNTPDDDIYFVLTEEGKSGYYSSGMEGGFGEKDIYHIKFPYYPYPRRYHVVELAGVVQDVNTLDAVPAIVRLIDSETDEVLDSAFTGTDMGKYSFMLEPERSYSLEVSANGYDPTSAELLTPTLVDEDIIMKKNLFMDKPGAKVVSTPVVADEAAPMNLPEIQNIYYDFDKDNIREDARQELDMVAEFLEQNSDIDLQILSHTDWFGTYDYNVDLSLRRANKAMNYLVSNKGIDPGRIETDFFSENRPLEANVYDKGRQFNRRSEFRFLKAGRVALTSVQLRQGVEGIAIDHTAPQGLAGYDNVAGLVIAGESPETGVANTVPNDASALGKNAIKNRNGEPTGKDAIKALLAGNENKNTVKGRNADLKGNAEASLSNALAGINLRHIYFDFDKYNLRAEAKAELDQLLGILARFPDLQIEVYGHTDAFGTVDYNQRLSMNRSEAATNYLLAHQVPETQILKRGFSENKPIASNDNAYGRQNNRRVEFRLLKNGKPILISQK
ncbi:MAG TPA: hypothetical protein ENJ82_14520, partial [Bacteroidetes bacterium]|nr:hypothetical protein [Bacteroidota bacterium]